MVQNAVFKKIERFTAKVDLNDNYDVKTVDLAIFTVIFP